VVPGPAAPIGPEQPAPVPIDEDWDDEECTAVKLLELRREMGLATIPDAD
jgi:hypothetical protein